MRVVVVGDGLLGRSIGALDPDVIVLGHKDIDVTSESSIRAALFQWRPDVLVNTAAVHNMAEAEADPQRAFDVNARAAERVAKLVPTIFSSTDYVFNGDGPHTEVLPGQQPRSVYGRSKLAGELATLEHGGIVVRVSGLFGHYVSRAKGHKGFPDALLKSHDPIRLPTDQVFSPTYAPDAAAVILGLVDRLGGGPISINHKEPFGPLYHATNRGSTSWAAFAESVLALTGHKRHILPVAMRDPIRPKDSSLKNTRLPAARHWQQGLAAWAQREGLRTFVSPLRDDE